MRVLFVVVLAFVAAACGETDVEPEDCESGETEVSCVDGPGGNMKCVTACAPVK